MEAYYNSEEDLIKGLKFTIFVFGVLFILIELIKIVLAILGLIRGRILLKGKIYNYLII